MRELVLCFSLFLFFSSSLFFIEALIFHALNLFFFVYFVPVLLNQVPSGDAPV